LTAVLSLTQFPFANLFIARRARFSPQQSQPKNATHHYLEKDNSNSNNHECAGNGHYENPERKIYTSADFQ